MTPQIKTGILVFTCISAVVIIPALLIAIHQYIYAIIVIASFSASFFLVANALYEEFILEITEAYLEEQEIMHRFNGDKEKIKFYKGFKKYFDGDITLEELEIWFEKHH